MRLWSYANRTIYFFTPWRACNLIRIPPILRSIKGSLLSRLMYLKDYPETDENTNGNNYININAPPPSHNLILCRTIRITIIKLSYSIQCQYMWGKLLLPIWITSLRYAAYAILWDFTYFGRPLSYYSNFGYKQILNMSRSFPRSTVPLFKNIGTSCSCIYI